VRSKGQTAFKGVDFCFETLETIEGSRTDNVVEDPGPDASRESDSKLSGAVWKESGSDKAVVNESAFDGI
jgi:hypothetical protein